MFDRCTFCGALTSSPRVLDSQVSDQVDVSINLARINQRKKFIVSRVQLEFPELGKKPLTRDLMSTISKKVRDLVFGDETGATLRDFEKGILYRDCLNDLLGYGRLEPFLRDPEVDEIQVYSIFRTMIKRHGEYEDAGVEFENVDQLYRIGQLVRRNGKRIVNPQTRTNEYICDGWRAVVADSAPDKDSPYLSFNWISPSSEMDESELAHVASARTTGQSKFCDDERIKKTRQFLTTRLRKEFPRLDVEAADSSIIQRARNKVRQAIFLESGTNLSDYERGVLFQDCLDDLFGFGPLSTILRDPSVKEIRVNAFNEIITRTASGTVLAAPTQFDDEKHLERVIRLLIKHGQARKTESKELEEYVIPQGIKVTVRRPPVPKGEPYVTLLMYDYGQYEVTE